MNRLDRNAGVELLRIICMLCIVVGHSAYHGAEQSSAYGAKLLWCGGDIGVNCFVMISGYFMVSSRWTIAKMLKLWEIVITYSVGLYLLMALCTGKEILSREFMMALFPITKGVYWFVSAYALLMLCTPALNHFLRSLEKKEMKQFLGAFFLLVVVVPFVFRGLDYLASLFLWFVMLYSLAAYVKLHGEDVLSIPSRKWYMLAALVFILLELTAHCAVQNYSIYRGVGNGLLNWLSIGRMAPLILLFSYLFFMGFVSCRIQGRGAVWINRIAACSFSVYLIHDNPGVRSILWNGLLQVKNMSGTPWLIPYCLGISVIIYIVCTLLELLRKYTVGQLSDYVVRRWVQPIVGLGWTKTRCLFDRLTNNV